MAETQDEPAAVKPPELPDGDYAIVECLGHRTLVGRIEEVQRFGAVMMQIEPIYQGALLPALFMAGASLYGVTPCTKQVALETGHRYPSSLPTTTAYANGLLTKATLVGIPRTEDDHGPGGDFGADGEHGGDGEIEDEDEEPLF